MWATCSRCSSCLSRLVAFTTTTRMVEEQRAEIGTLSALGYSRAQILRKYIVYAGLAAGIGSLIGAVFGIWFFPLVISQPTDCFTRCRL